MTLSTTFVNDITCYIRNNFSTSKYFFSGMIDNQFIGFLYLTHSIFTIRLTKSTCLQVLQKKLHLLLKNIPLLDWLICFLERWSFDTLQQQGDTVSKGDDKSVTVVSFTGYQGFQASLNFGWWEWRKTIYTRKRQAEKNEKLRIFFFYPLIRLNSSRCSTLFWRAQRLNEWVHKKKIKIKVL